MWKHDTEASENQKQLMQKIQEENANIRRELERVMSIQENQIQHSRNNDIKITGILPVWNKNILAYFGEIVKALNLNILEIGVDCIFRSKKIDMIIVRLLRRLDKNENMKCAKQKRLTGRNIGLDSKDNIYINEPLSSYVANVFYEARKI